MILLVYHVSDQGHNQEAGNHCHSHLKRYNHSLHSIPEISGAGASIPDAGQAGRQQTAIANSDSEKLPNSLDR